MMVGGPITVKEDVKSLSFGRMTQLRTSDPTRTVTVPPVGQLSCGVKINVESLAQVKVPLCGGSKRTAASVALLFIGVVKAIVTDERSRTPVAPVEGMMASTLGALQGR